jgi:hypothetical protein
LFTFSDDRRHPVAPAAECTDEFVRLIVSREPLGRSA